jgi:hypothetical protein
MRRPRLSDDDVQASLSFFFRHPQSRPFVDFLFGVLTEIGPSDTCALHAHNERRKFASDLLSTRAEEADSDGSDKADNGRKVTRPAEKQRKSRRHGPVGDQ